MNLKKGLLIMCCLGLLMGMVGCAEKEVQGGKEIDTDVNKPNADTDKDAYVFVSEGNSAYRLNPQTGSDHECHGRSGYIRRDGLLHLFPERR